MKCPKCHYLGFETGDRCKNCGYDFSLMRAAAATEEVDVDLTLHNTEQDASMSPGWLDSVDLRPPTAEESPVPAPAPLVAAAAAPALRRVEPALPLFSPTGEDDGDEPLIKLPVAPRPPLAVRKTPESPRLRAVPRSVRVREPEPEPVLAFEDPARSPEPPAERTSRPAVSTDPPASPGPRVAAAAIDNAILFGVDAVVVYLTVRMAGLTLTDWAALPIVPLAAFLLLLKVGYFCAFTAVGGQTIGKMASHLRVVTDTGLPLDGAAAIRRTCAGTVSALALGLGFLPAFMTADRRALHDRVAGTRVVSRRTGDVARA